MCIAELACELCQDLQVDFHIILSSSARCAPGEQMHSCGPTTSGGH
jgi:hypothetical protein